MKQQCFVFPGRGELGSCRSDSASGWAGRWKWSILEVWGCGGAEAAQPVVHQDYKLRQGRTCWSACAWQVVFEGLMAIIARYKSEELQHRFCNQTPGSGRLQPDVSWQRVMSSVGRLVDEEPPPFQGTEPSLGLLQGKITLSGLNSPQERWNIAHQHMQHMDVVFLQFHTAQVKKKGIWVICEESGNSVDRFTLDRCSL